MLTLQYAKAVPEVKFNAVEPGYTATELGGRVSGGGCPSRKARRSSSAWPPSARTAPPAPSRRTSASFPGSPVPPHPSAPAQTRQLGSDVAGGGAHSRTSPAPDAVVRAGLAHRSPGVQPPSRRRHITRSSPASPSRHTGTAAGNHQCDTLTALPDRVSHSSGTGHTVGTTGWCITKRTRNALIFGMSGSFGWTVQLVRAGSRLDRLLVLRHDPETRRPYAEEHGHRVTEKVWRLLFQVTLVPVGQRYGLPAEPMTLAGSMSMISHGGVRLCPLAIMSEITARDAATVPATMLTPAPSLSSFPSP